MTELQKRGRSRGVQYPTEAAINDIRVLLKGCGTAESILKELIQNAEDAGASKMEAVLVSGVLNSPISLIRGPGLLVLNDGEFTGEHRDAIFQMNLGTKATEERAIGRFGKGLKSVFAWCEAFFVLARTDEKLSWTNARTGETSRWEEPSVAELFNPWQGWRHRDWDNEIDAGCDDLFNQAEHYLRERTLVADAPWLAFWFPLRQRVHVGTAADREDEGWIEPKFPGDDPKGFFEELTSGLRSLAPSLVTLRNLRQISVSQGVQNQHSCLLEFPFPEQRIPGPESRPGEQSVEVQIRFCDDEGHRFDYLSHGVVGRFSDKKVEFLKNAEGWPSSAQRNRANDKAKGHPSFATLVTSTPAQGGAGTLEVRWCVFFPVGKQPVGASEARLSQLPYDITLNLHGFFFLDSERLRIDGLEDGFSADGKASNKTCVEWNGILAKEGALEHLPRAVSRFAGKRHLSGPQCCELAEAIRKLWIWDRFQSAICQLEGWRPCWRLGTEAWECVSTQKRLLFIPHTFSPTGVLASVPGLAQLSEDSSLALLAGKSPETLPGLHREGRSAWDDDHALRVLSGVQIGPNGHEAVAKWLNAFLDHLHKSGALTTVIRQRVSDLPLLSARDFRTNAAVRLSPNEWRKQVESRRLFADEGETYRWLKLLGAIAPQKSSQIALAGSSPSWFDGPLGPSCDAETAAKILLEQTEFGSLVERRNLFDAFERERFRSPQLVAAMRYLLHATETNRGEEGKLYLPSPVERQQVWRRLLDQLLEKTGRWRLLHEQWAPVLSPQLQTELDVEAVSAVGIWSALTKGGVDFKALEFPNEVWPAQDISAVLRGLFEVGEARRQDRLDLLRKLPLHELRGQLSRRVAVADDAGRLAEPFVLERPGFDAVVPNELRALWQEFLSQTKVVKAFPAEDLAYSVQQKIFQDVDGRVVELNWNYVVRHCLGLPDPSRWAPLIMEALHREGGHAARGVGQKLRNTRWLPLLLGGDLDPDSVVHIDGLDDDLHSLLDPARDGVAGIKSLETWITAHGGFTTLRANHLPQIGQALDMLGLWLSEKSGWHLGLTAPNKLVDLAPILSQVENCPDLPAAQLLTKLRLVKPHGGIEDMDLALEKYLLPSVLKKFDYKQDGVQRIERILRELEGMQNRRAFDAYLRQACDDGILKSFLSDLRLVNRLGLWGSARDLIWPSENLDPSAQLCEAQANILAALRMPAELELRAGNIQPDSGEDCDYRLTAAPDFGAEVDKLSEYLEPFRTGSLDSKIPAALVSVLGDHPKMTELLKSLLERLQRTPDVFRASLFGDAAASGRFVFRMVRGESVQAASITGRQVHVNFALDPSTLLAAEPFKVWWYPGCLHSFPSYAGASPPDSWCRKCHSISYSRVFGVLSLRWIEEPDKLENPLGVVASTIEAILQKFHSFRINVADGLSGISGEGQSDLRRSQAYLLDMAELRLHELGIKKAPEFDGILRQFDEVHNARVDADELLMRAPAKAEQRHRDAEALMRKAKQELKGLLESNEEESATLNLLQAVRRKMGDSGYGYSARSVPFELFQNADDALAELDDMQGGPDREPQPFVLELDMSKSRLDVVHWGRPIDQFEFGNFKAGKERGYDRDLLKMLTLNFSDKDTQGTRQSIATGRFGLGFKSVFFIAERPQVVSGRLAFEIRGGFFPVALSPSIAEELQNQARKLAAVSLPATVIRLQGRPEELNAVTDAVNVFSDAVPLLTIFSRRIRKVVVFRDGRSDTWSNAEEKLTQSGLVTLALVGQGRYLCFHCQLACDKRPATVLFHLDAEGVAALPTYATGIWITTPTRARSDLAWALNAPFSPDVGRQQLALGSPENMKIAERVAVVWGEGLIELYDWMKEHWGDFQRKTALHAEVTFERWWCLLWSHTTGGTPILDWSQIQDGGQILSWVAWNRSRGAMRRLILERASIPSELPGEFATLVRQDEIQFCVSGVLADKNNACFAEVAKWKSVKQEFPAGQTIHEHIGRFLEKVGGGAEFNKVTLQHVLATEVGSRLQVNPDAGDHIGALLTSCKPAFELTGSHAAEVQQVLVFIRGTTFLGTDGAYHPARALVCKRFLADIIEKDEVLRAEFAPNSAALSPTYSDRALVFFDKARERLAADSTVLAGWARDASDDRLAAVFQYIAHGDLGEELAVKLGRDWLDTKRNTAEYGELSEQDGSEVERKFYKGQLWRQFWPMQPPGADYTPHSTPPEYDRVQAFLREVETWWSDVNVRGPLINHYLRHQYPSNCNLRLREGDRRSWMTLLIRAMGYTVGRAQDWQTAGFINYCDTTGWLDSFSMMRVPPFDEWNRRWIGILDDSANQGLDYVEYHHWIKLLPFVYRVSTHLDDYVQNFCGLDYGNGTALNVYTILNPALDPELEGGLIAPSLSQTVGLGIFFILRELVRTNTIRGDRILSHCFVPSLPIRRAFGNLGCDIDLGAGRVARLEWSQQIMDFIRSHGVGDVTFSRAFDIPFIVLSNPLWLDSSDHEGRELSNFWIEWSNGQ